MTYKQDTSDEFRYTILIIINVRVTAFIYERLCLK